jgi:hypothetical protein
MTAVLDHFCPMCGRRYGEFVFLAAAHMREAHGLKGGWSVETLPEEEIIVDTEPTSETVVAEQ